jgi:putative DNA primase/helicase
VLCRRIDSAPPGWKLIKKSKDDFPIYVQSQENAGSCQPLGSRKPTLKAKPKAPSPAPIPEGAIALARLPEPVTCPEKRDRCNGKTETEYPYSDRHFTRRNEISDTESSKGYRKEVIPFHLNAEGKIVKGKGSEQWNPYRIQEVQTYGGAGKWVLGVEGESCVEAARSLGLVAFTLQGGSWTEPDLDNAIALCKAAGVVGITYFPDHDDVGYEKARKIAAAAAKAKLPFIYLRPTSLWSECPDKGDIADWVKWGMEQDWNKEEFIKGLEAQFNEVIEDDRFDAEFDAEDYSEDAPNSASRAEFTQIALEQLYGDKPWICTDDKLYYWTGTYYKLSDDDIEKRRLRDFCNFYPVPTKQGLTYPYAKPSKVKEVLEWVKLSLLVPRSAINPPGLNCINGVLQLEWSIIERQPVPGWKLIDHSPELYYTYEPLAKYDPEADGQACDRLLQVLDAPQRDIFLKTIAASLDLKTIRKHKGRLVRGLLLKGHGANGKDTLREAVAAMYGYQGLTGCTLADFAMYDEGRKFPLARLKHSRCNWASENGSATRLDKIQSLKAFITGDTLSAEGKGKDENEFVPSGIALFNINDTPKLQGTLEAIASRYGVLTFNKTFKIGADPAKGELEADPRFKYDPNFLQEEVLPAFLNRILDALQRLMLEGINYDCTQQALEDIQAENSHLFQFCQDVGLVYDPHSLLTAGEIWERLERWYQDNGTLEYEEANGKRKAIWSEQANPYDRNVKAPNQVLARFKQLFPKAKSGIIKGGKKPTPVLHGIGFTCGNTPTDDCCNNSDFSTPIPPQCTPIPPQSPPQKTTQNQGFHPNEGNFSYSVEKIEFEDIDLSNEPQETEQNSIDPKSLPSLGWDDAKSSIPGVEHWGGIGVENSEIGVEVAIESEALATEDTCDNELPQEQDIEGIARILASDVMVPNAQDLAFVRAHYSREALAAASRLLRDRFPERHAQIKQMVLELNEQIEPVQPVAKSPSPIKVGSRVRFIGKGSIRCGMLGTVKAITGGAVKIWLDYHSDMLKIQV